jgi:mono/diheme cytochrome c family protein
LRTRRFQAIACLLIVAAFAGGCHRDMRDQARYDPLERSDFFADGVAAREPVPGTVARGSLREDPHFYRGMVGDTLATTLPVRVTGELLTRGQERFNVNCSPCHGRVGNGLGMIVRRGYKQPSSFHIDRLRNAAPGYFFDVISHGFGTMPSYAVQVSPADRWAIVAYIRALQMSQYAGLDELPAEVRREFERLAPPPGESDEKGSSGEGHQVGDEG